MKAFRENRQLFIKSDFTKAQVPFKRVHGVIHWGNPKSDDEIAQEHALVVGGEMENGRYYVLNEFCGGVDKLLSKAIEFKDDLLIDYFHVPPQPPGLLNLAYEVDGLTRYKVKSINRWGDPIREASEPREKWPTFRDWDVTATVLEYADPFLDDFDACQVVAERLANAKRVEFSVYNLPRLEKVRGQNDRAESSVFRAFVYLIWYLWQSSETNRPLSRTKLDPSSWPWGEEFVNL